VAVALESQDNALLGSYKVSRLQCTPYYTDFPSHGLFYLAGAEVIPSSAYELRAYSVDCKGNEAGCSPTSISPPLTAVTTRRHGDVATPFAPTGTQPDPQDVVAVLNKFKSLAGSPAKAYAQVQPNVPDINLDTGALDIVAVVDAFKGFAYPYSGPCACPSAVACTTCSAQTCGAGNTCIRLCSGGAQAGLPCLGNQNCPGGTCPVLSVGTPGQCRDRCQRCN
jgi:hypothetical protein